MRKPKDSLDGVQQLYDCPKSQHRQTVYECAALLKATEVRMSHLTSNWFHQTWKLHCYLVFCLGGSGEESFQMQ